MILYPRACETQLVGQFREDVIEEGAVLMTEMGSESQLRIMRVEALYCHDAEPLN